MSNKSTPPRILIVTPEVAFMPEGSASRTNFISAADGGFNGFLAELICHLFDLGADVHVAQPDFRTIFAIRSRKEKSGVSVKLPYDRVHLAEDRAIFYSKPINSNSEWENIKISLAFQREVLNQIVPRVVPDLIHCADWMTGLIPAAARKVEIPCLFTVQKFDSTRCILAEVEDSGIDAAGFWQNLFYDSFPGSYEQTRDTNPLDMLLSGILAASHVNTAAPQLMPNPAGGANDHFDSPLGQVLAQKWKAGCASEIPGPPYPGRRPTSIEKLYGSYRFQDQHAGNPKNDQTKRHSPTSSDNRTAATCYIDLYETILQQPLVAPAKKKVWSINKNSGINISGMRVIPHRKAPRIKPYTHTSEKVSTVAMAPI